MVRSGRNGELEQSIRRHANGEPRAERRAINLINCEEDRALRAVLVGMLREAERSGPS